MEPTKENGANNYEDANSGIAKRTWDWMRGKKPSKSDYESSDARIRKLKSKSAELTGAEPDSEKENTSPGSSFTSLSLDANASSGPSSWERVQAPTHTDDKLKAEDPSQKNAKRRSLRLSAQPKGTLVYTVSGNETLASVAARFDTTLSELKKLNRLMTATIWSGQTLYVPDKNYEPSPPPSPSSLSPTLPASPRSQNSSSPTPELPRQAPGVARPVGLGGGAEGGGAPPEIGGLGMRPTTEERKRALETAMTEKFVKVHVKHITDGQGVVRGTLLVTPNAFMFDPDVSDSLVVERGAEKYGLMAPMDSILSVAMYHDIAAMRLKTNPQDVMTTICKAYHSDTCPMYTQPQNAAVDTAGAPDLIKDIPEGVRERTRTESNCSCGQDGAPKSDETKHSGEKVSEKTHENVTSQEKTVADKAHHKPHISSDINQDNSHTIKGKTDAHKLSTTVTSQKSDASHTVSMDTSSQGESHHAKKSNVDNTVPCSKLPTIPEPEVAKSQESANSVQFSLGHHSGEHTTDSAINKLIPSTTDGIPLVTSVTQAAPDANSPGLLSRTLGSISSLSSTPGLSTLVDYSSGLFARKDSKVKDIHDLAPLDDESQPSGIFYVNVQSNASDSSATEKVHVESAVSLEDRPELFRSLDALIPRPAAQYEDPPLYLCLKLRKAKASPKATSPIEAYAKTAFKPEYWFSIPKEKVDKLYAFFLQWSPSLYDNDEVQDVEGQGFVVVDEDSIDLVENHFDTSRQLSQSWKIMNMDEIHSEMPPVEDLVIVPELEEDSKLLSKEQIIKLGENLPARAEGYSWSLQYSSAKHGISLKTLYRTMKGVDCPVLLVVKDTSEQIFGAMLSCGPMLSDHFMGSGETYLYTFYPEFKIFRWTGANDFYMKGNKESLVIGASEGVYGLWLDGDLYHGRTHFCSTFNNDVLTKREDFTISAVECWTFL